jgi:hypothetical protein
MTLAALLALVVYLAVGFGLRTWLQVRRTGDTGFRGLSGRPGTPEWWAGILFAVALVAGLLGPVTALFGLEPADRGRRGRAHRAGHERPVRAGAQPGAVLLLVALRLQVRVVEEPLPHPQPRRRRRGLCRAHRPVPARLGRTVPTAAGTVS